jgi:cell division protein FtsZ
MVAAYQEPAPVEPVVAAAEAQPDLYAAAAHEPALAPAFAPAPTVTRIVDPAVAEEEDDEPLFAEPAFESRRPRGGFLSLFGGRPRYEAPPAHAPAPRATAARGGALPIEVAAAPPEVEAGEDLEIPSFLRRLAN